MKNKFVVIIFFAVCQISYGQTTIQMKKEGGVFTVPCKVNGLDLRFIFDTGASDVSISLTEALFMKKNGLLNSNDILGKQYFSDATGGISEGTKILIRKIEFAGLVLTNVEASVVNSLDAPLLLGQSAMSQLGKFQFDPNNGTLTLLTGKSASTNNNITTTSSSQAKNNCADIWSGSLINNPFGQYFSGTMCTYSSAPILAHPDKLTSQEVGTVTNNQVQIISRYNEKYYYVKSGNVEGYLWAGWFKN